jgi:hypothetical protein
MLAMPFGVSALGRGCVKTKNCARVRSLLFHFDSKVATATTIKEQFVWCAVCVWSALDDADMSEFAELKALRDDIAHGRKDVVRSHGFKITNCDLERRFEVRTSSFCSMYSPRTVPSKPTFT